MEIIYGGNVKRNSGEDQEITVRRLMLNDMKAILEVQDKVASNMTDGSLLQPLDEEEYRSILLGDGLIIGAYAGESLIAFRALLVPKMDHEHLGLDIGLEGNELEKVIYQEISVVLPEYRGNKLQRTLAILIMQELIKENREFQYVCCTVAPFNIPSLKDKFAQGMEIAAFKEKYNGKLRYIFVKNLAKPEMQKWDQVITIPMENKTTQQQKINQGWRGFQIELTKGKWHVYYGK